MTRPSLILEKALAVLRRRGWCQHSFSNHGRVCAIGAIAVVLHGSPGSCGGPIRDLVEAVIDGDSLVTFNDTPGRKKADVEQLLLDAISLARSEEAVS